MVLEVVGYIGSFLVVISMLMSSIVKLRVINTIGSVISGVYAVICGALPLALMNLCLIIINVINLVKLLGRKIPAHNWVKAEPLGLNDTVRQMKYAKNPVARLGYKILTGKVEKAIEKGKPDLNLLFIYNIPFRGMAKMMNGMVSMDMAEDITTMVNGHWHKGLFRLLKHFFRRPKLETGAGK